MQEKKSACLAKNLKFLSFIHSPQLLLLPLEDIYKRRIKFDTLAPLRQLTLDSASHQKMWMDNSEDKLLFEPPLTATQRIAVGVRT